MSVAYNNFSSHHGPDPVTLGVAFSGGGVRSFSQVAILRDLEKRSIPLTAVAGTSMGAAVAALVAAGLEAAEVEKQLLDSEEAMVELGLFKPNIRMLFPKSTETTGMVDAQQLIEFFSERFKAIGIERLSDLKMPAAFVSVDIRSLRPVVFSNQAAWFNGMEGVDYYEKDIPIGEAIAASAAFPLAISAVSMDDYILVDGGVRLNIPSPIFNRQLIDVVLALSHVSPPDELNPKNPVDIVVQSMGGMSEQLEAFQREKADLSIRIPVDAEVFDWGKGVGIIELANAYLRNNPQSYTAYYDMIKEREEDWVLEQEEIRERQVREKARKEKESAAENRGITAFFKRFRGR